MGRTAFGGQRSSLMHACRARYPEVVGSIDIRSSHGGYATLDRVRDARARRLEHWPDAGEPH